MRILEYRIEPKFNACTVLNVLKNKLGISSSLIAKIKLIENGICLDMKNVHVNERVHTGQLLTVVVNTSLVNKGVLPFQILYEDEDVLIIDKPSGCAAHGSRYDENVMNVENYVNEYYGNDTMFHPVSRLDKGTSGVMTIAKNGYMHHLLGSMLHSDNFVKSYTAIVEGELVCKKGTINLPIGRTVNSAIKREIRNDGSYAVTEFEVLSSDKTKSIVKCIPVTGRTHQIRVHMAALGHPLFGDWLYGTERPELIKRPALHSSRLNFVHPISLKEIEIRSDMPDDMQSLILNL